jgi:UDP-N-acetylmuramate dehydrogenase
MLKILENQPLAPLTTFGIGGPARYFVAVKTAPEIPEALAWAEERDLPVFILGGGSNLLVPDNGFDGLVMQIDLRGVTQDKPWSPDFMVGAGEPWDRFVDQAIEANCAGIECLAGIPGSTGGTPVQNVGAYGQEVSQTIRVVHVYDRVDKQFRQLSNDECGFRYRESIFNTTTRGRYIVTAVVFLLHYDKPNLSYADLQKRFEGRWRKPKLREVAEAVREIRRSKGMLIVPGDPDCRSAGSFFKNPIVNADALPHIATALGIDATAIPNWPAENGQIKLPAAWLLERAGFTKGFADGAAGISSRHTLALINRGNATFADIERLQNRIIATVCERFGITLEREPVLLG